MSATSSSSDGLPPPEHLTLETLDAFPTQATLHLPSASSYKLLKPACLIASATGTPARLYSAFAAYLASHGHPTLTFDYRFVGRSFPSGVDAKSHEARVEALKSSPETNFSLHWTRDVGGAIRALKGRCCSNGTDAQRELVYIGNSHGAHLLVLALQERDLVDRVMAVSAFAPYFGYWPDAELRKAGMRYVLSASRKEGFFLATLMGAGRQSEEEKPDGETAKQAGLGFDLPLGCGEEWVRWCHFSRYMATEHAHAWSTYTTKRPLVSIGWTDDPLPKGDVLAYDQMLVTMPLVRTHRLMIDPKKMGKGWEAGCRHVDCFRDKQKDGAWEMLRRWVENGEEPTGEGVIDRRVAGGDWEARSRDTDKLPIEAKL